MIVDLRCLSFFFGGRKVERWLRVDWLGSLHRVGFLESWLSVGLRIKFVVLWLFVDLWFIVLLRLVIILGWLLIISLRCIKVKSLMLLSVSVEHIIVVFFLVIGVILVIVRSLLRLWKTRPWDVLFTSWLVTEAISVAIITDVVAELVLLF